MFLMTHQDEDISTCLRSITRNGVQQPHSRQIEEGKNVASFVVSIRQAAIWGNLALLY